MVKNIQITAETRYHFNKGTVNLLLYVNIYQQDAKFRTDFGEKGRVTCRLRDPSCNENLMENPVIVGCAVYAQRAGTDAICVVCF